MEYYYWGLLIKEKQHILGYDLYENKSENEIVKFIIKIKEEQ